MPLQRNFGRAEKLGVAKEILEILQRRRDQTGTPEIGKMIAGWMVDATLRSRRIRISSIHELGGAAWGAGGIADGTVPFRSLSGRLGTCVSVYINARP